MPCISKTMSTMKKKNSIFAIPIIILGLLLLARCSSKENETNLIKPETSSFTDPRDGKIYKTVKIGDQWIMAENLAYKPDIGNFWAYENIDSNILIYGYLYDWETAMNIAPDGWHLPSRDEWIDVRKALGGKHGTWKYLEEIYPKLIAGGSSGLNMLLGGVRTCDGKYRYLGDKARFWTSTTSPPFQYQGSTMTEKSIYGLDSNKEGVPHGLKLSSKAPYMFQNNQFRESCSGFSVRLFKD